MRDGGRAAGDGPGDGRRATNASPIPKPHPRRMRSLTGSFNHNRYRDVRSATGEPRES